MGRFETLIERLPALAPAEPAIEYAFEILVRAYAQGGKVMVCGNGGSAADAEHIVGELMKGMSGRRQVADEGFLAELATTSPEHADYLSRHLDEALPALSLCSQRPCSARSPTTSRLTWDLPSRCTATDEPVTAYGRSRPPAAAGMSSWPPLRHVRAASRGLALTGEPGTPLGDISDVWIKVPAATVADAQELHLPIYHALCEALEQDFFGEA